MLIGANTINVYKIKIKYLLSTVMVSLVITVVELDVFTVVVVVEDNSCLVNVFWWLLISTLFDVDVTFKLEFELKINNE